MTYRKEAQPKTDKQSERERIAQQTQEFINAGGAITQLHYDEVDSRGGGKACERL